MGDPGRARPGRCPIFLCKKEPDRVSFGGDYRQIKDSLRRELPHTRNPGPVRATANCRGSFWRETSKQPRDRVVGVWGGFFFTFFSVFFSCFV